MLSAFLLMGISTCSPVRPNPVTPNPEYEEYYRGSEGVWMQWARMNPPPITHFYATSPDPQTNSFELNVELHNIGASDAYGALFIRGYDPNILYVEGTDLSLGLQGACSIGLGNSPGGIGDFLGFSITCPQARLSYYNGGNMHASARGIGSLLGLPGMDYLNFDRVGENWRMNFDWSAIPATQYDQFNHGRLFSLMLASGTNFLAVYGYPFNDVGVLRGDNYYYPGGESAYQTFRAHIVDWPLGLDHYDVDFTVDACYGYTTYASPLICIDPQPYEYQPNECIPQEYKWSGSQGAPVAITSVKQVQTPRSIQLSFTVRNVGRGTVVHPGFLEWCSPHHLDRFDDRFKDVIYIGDVRVGQQTLLCSPGYEIRLRDGVGTFSCEYFFPTGATSAYETPVVVELWYGYHDWLQGTTRIKRAG